MKKFSKITCAILLCALVLTTLLIPMQAFAASYTYNWGKRGEVATSLSDKAKAFYTGSYTFANLSNASGGTSQSNAPSSALYTQLKTLMTSKHTKINSYKENNTLLSYTDCQNGGGKISSFYSGKEIGPAWDSAATWNKEHTWPNSKGLGGSDEDDVMMIRPTAVSENSSRGNTAYGKSSGYYNPNSESGGKYDLRGDVARICLYVYTRWGNTSRMWGSSGVMESLDVLLEWMQADPVDTWEMGRNDAVQSITGTRNAFVDYPEYAFLLFGKAVPANYATPSGSNGATPPKPEVCEHSFSSATCTEPQTCTKCWTTQGSALGHTEPNADGLCDRCGKVLEISAPDSLEVGKAYYMSVLQGNLDNKILYFNGTTREADNYPWYFKTSEDKANAVQVFVEEAQGGYKLYFMNGTTKTYIRLYERSSGKASLELVTTAPAEVYVYDTTHKTLILTVGSNKYYIGTYNTFDTLSGSNISYINTSFPCIFIPAEGGSVVPPVHTHSFGQATCTTPATCSCGATQGNALGHTTTNGTCTRCGTVVGGGGTVTPPVSGETISVNFQNSTGSTSLNGTGSVKFTASRAVDNWDDGTRGLQFLKQTGAVTLTSTSVTNVSSITLDISENKSINITVTVKVGNTVLTCNGGNSATVGKGTNQKITFTASSAVSGVITIEMVPAQSGTSGLGSIYLASIEIATSSGSQGGGQTHTHSFSQATCTEPAKCSCGETQGTPLGHNEVIDQAVSATCTTAGKTEGKHCSRCNTVIVAQTTIPATGHTEPNAEGKCDTCGAQLVDMQLAINNFKSSVASVQSAVTLQSKFNAIKVAVSAYDSLNDIQKAQVTTELATLKTQIESYNAEISKQNENSSNALAIVGVSIVAVAAVALMFFKKVF